MKYHTIKVSSEERELIKKMRLVLKRRGYDSLKMDEIAKKHDIDLDEFMDGTLGSAIGLGCLALLEMLEKRQ